MFDHNHNSQPPQPQNNGFPSPQDTNDLPDQTTPQPEQQPTPKRKSILLLRRIYLILILIGLIGGGLLAWGVIAVMDQLDLINPAQEEIAPSAE